MDSKRYIIPPPPMNLPPGSGNAFQIWMRQLCDASNLILTKWGNQEYVYDDLQVSISNVKLPASNDPDWVDWDHGVAAGVTYPVLGFALNEYIYFEVQTSHQMRLNSILDVHCHYSVPSDGTGDRFKFQLDVVAAGIGEAWAVPTGSPFTAEKSMTTDESDTHKLLELADIPAVNTTVSTIYKCKLTRIAATQDEYAGDVYISYIDCHYQKDSAGSYQEGSKE